MGLCGSAPSERPLNKNAVDITHFNLLKVVGQGGFGRVHLAEQVTTGDLIALKRIVKKQMLKNQVYITTQWYERNVMRSIHSVFTINLSHAFQDRTYIYLVMPFCSGGDLKWYLKQHGRMEEDLVRFYAAELLLGMEHIHSKNIVYRDMKPDNLLIDGEGHLRISDFGLAVILTEKNNWKTKGGAGTLGYQAPEVVSRKKYGCEVDVWTFGVVIFQLLHNSLPFSRKEKFPNGVVPKFRFRTTASPMFKDLLKKILTSDQHARLGWEQIKAHPWFAGLDWQAAAERKLVPPFLPDPEMQNYAEGLDQNEHHLELKEQKESLQLTEEQHAKFAGYDYNVGWPPSKNAVAAHVVVNEEWEATHDHHEQYEENPNSHNSAHTYVTGMHSHHDADKNHQTIADQVQVGYGPKKHKGPRIPQSV